MRWVLLAIVLLLAGAAGATGFKAGGGLGARGFSNHRSASSAAAFLARQWGPFSTSDYFTAPAANWALDAGTGDFMHCVSFRPSSLAATQTLVSDTSGAPWSNGFAFRIPAAGSGIAFAWASQNGFTNNSWTAGADFAGVGVWNWVCYGRLGATFSVRMNNGASSSTYTTAGNWAGTDTFGNTSAAATLGVDMTSGTPGSASSAIQIRAVYATTTGCTAANADAAAVGISAGRFTSDGSVTLNCAGADFDGATLTCQTGGAWSTTGTVPYTDP